MYFNREWCLVKENATREGIMVFEHFGLEQGKTKLRLFDVRNRVSFFQSSR